MAQIQYETKARALLQLVAPWVVRAKDRLAVPDPEDDPRAPTKREQAAKLIRLVGRVENVSQRSRLGDPAKSIEELREFCDISERKLEATAQRVHDGEEAAFLDGLAFIASLRPTETWRDPLAICMDPPPDTAELGPNTDDCNAVVSASWSIGLQSGECSTGCSEPHSWQDPKPSPEAPFWTDPEESEDAYRFDESDLDVDELPQRPARETRTLAELHP
jgi:hypothetical protein